MTVSDVVFLVADEGEEAVFCCSPDQVADLKNNFGMITGIMGRCPSCVKNLRTLFCSLACDPHHSKFLSANETKPFENETLVTKLDIYINEQFAVDMFDSCKEVTNPSSNSRAITTLCGAWGELCNADR